jgi:TatD DNase family protein
LHPWRAPGCSAAWLERLREHLDEFPQACLGECGLDRWITPHDFPGQQQVFVAQLELAAEHDLPISVHCLRAWGPLLQTLRDQARPPRGFLLHSYGGSPEMVGELADLGAWFSFSGHFLHPRKDKAREAFRRVPRERLLVETDAPDMVPPDSHRPHVLIDGENRAVNHPANLPRIIEGLAETRSEAPAALSAQLSRNFVRFFTVTPPSGS